MEKFDLNVSALYIAQVKQKCGLELGENYNKSKKDNLVVQECPKKIKMLFMDALKYFGVIVQEG